MSTRNVPEAAVLDIVHSVADLLERWHATRSTCPDLARAYKAAGVTLGMYVIHELESGRLGGMSQSTLACVRHTVRLLDLALSLDGKRDSRGPHDIH